MTNLVEERSFPTRIPRRRPDFGRYPADARDCAAAGFQKSAHASDLRQRTRDGQGMIASHGATSALPDLPQADGHADIARPSRPSTPNWPWPTAEPS